MDKTKTTIRLFDKYALLYQEKYMDVNLYKDSLEIFCNTIKKGNATILELACGPGNITKYLLQKHPDLNILGIDLSEKMIALASENNPSAKFKIMDCRDIFKLKNKFDAIVAGFCLPYLSKEETIKLISDSAQLLNPNGVIYLSTMEDDYSKSGLVKSSSGNDNMYIYYHQSDYLLTSLSENAFDIIDVQRQKYADHNAKMVTDLLIVAKK